MFVPSFHVMAASDEEAPGRELAKQATRSRETWSTTDHSKHFVLTQEYISGAEVTDACISCHTEAAAQIQESIHWTWIDPKSDKETLVGKAGHSVNNFYISTNLMNDSSCIECHTGWDGKAGKINCLRCHGQTEFNFPGAFEKLNRLYDADDEKSEELAEKIQKDVQKAIQDISRPTRKNCGSCHFFGDGGDGVKHGDLDSSLTNPDKALDVHMARDGQNFQCFRCHTTRRHYVAGRIYSTPAVTHRRNLLQDDLIPRIMCESCHGDKPHKPDKKANDHTDKVACQSCHIPKYARANPTQLWWDWSKAGKKKDGKSFKKTGPLGKYSYISTKGAAKWDSNVTPEYFWFSGSINTLTVKDVIDPDSTVRVSWPVGNLGDKKSRIFPFKVHRGKQPYDTESRRLLAPLLSGEDGFWTTLDMKKALIKGMEYMNLPYSGNFDFVETSYVFPITHMVAPKEKALDCTACHRRKGSRLANLVGFYMPARDGHRIVDVGGWSLIIALLVGILLHASGRIFSRKRKGN